MRFSLSLGLLSLVSLALASQFQQGPPKQAIGDGTYEATPGQDNSKHDLDDFTPLFPRDPETHPDFLDSELHLLKARQSGAAGPNLSQNFAIVMIYSDEPDKAADFWGSKDAFYYFTLRSGQIMLVDDGSNTERSENRYYSFAYGYNEWAITPNSKDKWTIDSKTGVMKWNGQTIFAICLNSGSDTSVGIQGTSKQTCLSQGMDFKRIFFRAINRKAQLPSQSVLGSLPQN